MRIKRIRRKKKSKMIKKRRKKSENEAISAKYFWEIGVNREWT